MSEDEQIKYYELCCNHVSIDRPVQTFSRCDDYKFMEIIEKKLGVKHVGNFRDQVASSGIKYLTSFIK